MNPNITSCMSTTRKRITPLACACIAILILLVAKTLVGVAGGVADAETEYEVSRLEALR